MASKRKTAAEAIAEAQADPDWVAARASEEETRTKMIAEWSQAEAPVVRALNAKGAGIEAVWDLLSFTKPYPELVPVLLEHLTKPYPDKVLEGIGRALAVPAAIKGWRLLVDTFRANPDTSGTGSRWAVALAIAQAADASVEDELISLVRDPTVGPDRVALLDALYRLDGPRSREVLAELEADPVFAHQIKLCRRVKRRKTTAAVKDRQSSQS